MNRKSWRSRIIYALLSLAVLSIVAYAFIPAPVLVDVETVRRGNLEVTVEDDGKTRIKEKYIIASPLAGRLARVQLHAGDSVEAGKTVLTTLDPVAPSLLDVRSRAEAQARAKAAELTVKRAQAVLALAQEKSRFTHEEFDRAQALYERNSISHEERDRAENRWIVGREELRMADLSQQIAAYELQQAQAALLHVERASADELSDPDDWRIDIRSPISGQVLRVLQESATVVTTGTPLMEVGDPFDLEVVIDVLSSEAVKIREGNRALLDDWGGSKPLKAHVRRVEPSGFTKISALGIEEQRVNVILDFDDPSELRAGLADDFRVDARIIVAEARDVLKVPNAAIFRRGTTDFTFVVKGNSASICEIQLGQRGRLESEVKGGLAEGDLVVVYPSDKVGPGVKVKKAIESR